MNPSLPQITERRLAKPWQKLVIPLSSCLLPWVALPLRYAGQLGIYRVLIGFSSALAWVRFMTDSFKFSTTLGPLVLMVTEMFKGDVLVSP